MNIQRVKYLFIFSFFLLCFYVSTVYGENINQEGKDSEGLKTQQFRHRAYQVFQDYSEDDVKAEIDFGRNLAARILGKYKLVQDEKLARYISLLGTGLAAQIGRPELQYYFAVIDADDVNAYACPGGYIFITKGTIKTMANEAQLVGVLAHEIAHVNQRHVVKKLKIAGQDKSMASSFASFIGGGTASFRMLIDKLTNEAYLVLFEEGLDKRDEFESDSLALQMMTGMGYSWKSYKEYISNLKGYIEKGKGSVVSKTHPTVEERVSNMESEVSTNKMEEIEGKLNQQRFNENVNL